MFLTYLAAGLLAQHDQQGLPERGVTNGANYISNGMGGKYLDLNFTGIGPKKCVLPVILQVFVRENYFEP